MLPHDRGKEQERGREETATQKDNHRIKGGKKYFLKESVLSNRKTVLYSASPQLNCIMVPVLQLSSHPPEV